MKRLFGLLVLIVIFTTPFPVIAAPKEVFTDPVTGYEIWRMTNSPERDIVQYYDFPTISPNGKYLIFRSNRSAYLYIINTDGSNEKSIGNWSTWNSSSIGTDIDFSANNLQGWWSHDSRYYYSYNKLYAIDIEKFQNNELPENYIRLISPSHGDNFYYPMVSPDGKKLFGVSISGDSIEGGTLKFINIDGTGYKEFNPPYYVVPGSVALDVTHGWLGNDQAWYMNDDDNSYGNLNSQIVFNVADGSKASAAPTLEVRDSAVSDIYSGIMNHMTMSPSAYFIGHGEGFVAGHGRSYKYANTNYLSQDSAVRQLTKVGDTVANHYMFSPDAKWLSTVDTSGSNRGYLMAYPINPVGQPIKIAKVFTGNPNDYSVSADPRFSPDGTKNIYYGDIREAGNSDIYIAIIKKPDSPSNLSATKSGTNVSLTWIPASLHREIKQYEVQWSSSQNGTYQFLATIPVISTYLNNSSKISISDTTITVDDATLFPTSGVIEVSGLSTEKPSELISYSNRTATTFTGCTRGYGGSTPTEHYNDSFVWVYTGITGYADHNVTTNKWYQIKAVEWSGLSSNFSNPVTYSEQNTMPEPGDANGDGHVDGIDYVIWANGITIQGRDYVIWLNNFGK
jgi:hypothetical protein